MSSEYLPSPQEIAEHILGPIQWTDFDTGYIECPGRDLHSKPTGKRDCRVKISGAPNLYCFHSSCAGVLEPLSKELQRKIPSGDFRRGFRPLPPRRQPPTREQILKQKAKKALPEILAKYPQQLEPSPTALTGDPHKDGLLFLDLFNDDDVLWVGNKEDSAADDKPEAEQNRCALHFVPVWRWKRRLYIGWQDDFQLTCPSVFKPGSHSRCNDNVITKRYLVVESDKELPGEKVVPVLQWLRQYVPLRAVVFSGNTSWHGWFDQPEPAQLADLEILLPELGCDKAMFKYSQPARRPGGLRPDTGKYQDLLWLNLENKASNEQHN